MDFKPNYSFEVFLHDGSSLFKITFTIYRELYFTTGSLLPGIVTLVRIKTKFISLISQRNNYRSNKLHDELLVGMISRDLIEMLNDKILGQLLNRFSADIPMDLMRHGILSFDWQSQSIFQTLKNRYVLDILTSLGPKAAVLVAKILTFKIKNIVNI